MKTLLTVAFFLSLPQAFATPDIRTDCETLTDTFRVRICFYRTAGSQSRDIMYFFHGLTGNELSWRDSFEALRKDWALYGYEAPIVVSISFGDFWLLAEKNPSPQSGYYEYFMWKLMPYIEKKTHFSPERGGGRIIMGQSMGGFNALQVFMKNMTLFRTGVFLCPAVTTLTPYASKLEINDYIQRNEADSFLVNLMVTLARKIFPDVPTWMKAAPLDLATKFVQQHMPPFYLQCGMADDYGFFEGFQKMVHIAMDRSAPITYNITPGGHCGADLSDVADFMFDPWRKRTTSKVNTDQNKIAHFETPLLSKI